MQNTNKINRSSFICSNADATVAQPPAMLCYLPDKCAALKTRADSGTNKAAVSKLLVFSLENTGV